MAKMAVASKMSSSDKTGGKRGGAHGSNSGSSSSSNSGTMMKMAAASNSSGATKGGRRGCKGTRKMRGGMYALSPHSYNGKGSGTSGVDLQFVAGNAG
jgi:hypothetical protein